LDVDPNKKIADLSEKLIDFKNKDAKSLPEGSQCKAIIELNKESYLIASIKTNRTKLGLCLL
jgi:hypothetical protein